MKLGSVADQFAAWSLLCLLAVGGCDAIGGDGEQGVYGLRLQAHNGFPAIDVAARLTPAPEGAPPVQPTSQLIVDALRACGDEVRGNLGTTLTLAFRVEDGKLGRSLVQHAAGSPEACLASALEGAELATGAPAELTIQLAKAPD